MRYIERNSFRSGGCLALLVVALSGCTERALPVSFPEKASAVYEEIPIQNAGFESWVPTQPTGWGIYDVFDECVRRDLGAIEGRVAMMSAPSIYYNSFTQQTVIPKAAADNVMALYVDVRAWEAESVSCSIRIEGVGFFHSDFHPGDGAWHTLRVSCRVPPYAVGESLTLILGHSNQPKRAALFDQVKLVISRSEVRSG